MLANDLNPAAARACVGNAVRNGVADRVHVYNLDATEFVRRGHASISAAAAAPAAAAPAATATATAAAAATTTTAALAAAPTATCPSLTSEA